MNKTEKLYTIAPLTRAEYEELLASLAATVCEARDAINKAKLPREETLDQQHRRRMGPVTVNGSGCREALLTSLFWKVWRR